MMVKNEEELLPQCLESIHDLVDEIIVVDTGSEDRTVKIAKSYGAKVYHHPWENNFSKHRNQSISYTTGDWFLIIDADEELNNKKIDPGHLKKVLSSVPEEIHAIYMTVIDYKRTGKEFARYKSARLFRNHVGVHYEGEIHNQVEHTGGFRNSDLQIFHYGYDLDEEKMEEKFQRTTRLLKKRIRENPDDYDAYFYLANSHGQKGDLDKAIEYAEKSLTLVPKDHPNKTLYQSNYFTLGTCYLRKSKHDEAIQWALKGLDVIEDDPNLLYIMTVLGLRTDQPELTRKYGELYLEAWESVKDDPVKFGMQFVYHADGVSKNTVQYRLLTADIMQGKMEQFEERWQQIFPQISERPKWQSEILNNLAAAGFYEELLEKLEQILPESSGQLNLLKNLLPAIQSEQISSHRIVSVLKGLPNVEYNLDVLFRRLYESGEQRLAFDLVDEYGEEKISGTGLAFSVLRGLQNAGEIEQATALGDRILHRHRPDAKALNGVLEFYHETGNTKGVEETFSTLLQQVESYKALSNTTLLILALHLFRSDDFATFLDVTEALQAKNNLAYSEEVEDLSDLGKFFGFLGEHYIENQRKQEVLFAQQLAYLLAGEERSLNRAADYFTSIQDYPRANLVYRWLIDQGYVDQNLLETIHGSVVDMSESSNNIRL